MKYTFEVIFSERIYRETDGEFTGDFVYPAQRKNYLTIKGALRTYSYWQNNKHQALKMYIKDENGNSIAMFERNLDGEVVKNVQSF
jgi:hypothetical protein